jgi:hypothetical protein
MTDTTPVTQKPKGPKVKKRKRNKMCTRYKRANQQGHHARLLVKPGLAFSLKNKLKEIVIISLFFFLI